MSTRSTSEVTFPDTPAGHVAAEFVRYFETDVEDISFAEFDALYHPDVTARWPPQDDETRRKIWRKNRELGRGFSALAGVEEVSPSEIAVVIDFENQRTFRITLTIEEGPPHRITDERWDQVHDFELVLREATEADADVLSDIERRSPVVTDTTSVATDRGEDYFASARLMDDVTVILAEIDGEPAGVAWGALHRAVVTGAERRMWYFFHLRVLPTHQKKGMWGALLGKLRDIYDKPEQYFYGHFSLGNVAWKHVASQRVAPSPGMWRPGVMRARLHTDELAGPPAGRPAAAADAPRIVEVLNAFHGREEMYLPYTVGSFTSRVSKDPSLYGWDRVWIGDRAVVGVWPVGDKVRTITTRDGETTESRPGYVLDYGFEPGAAEEFERLIRAWSGWLVSRGMDRLSIFTSEGSSGFSVIRQLTEDVEQLVMNTSPPIPPPEDLTSRGLYVDHVYF